MRRSALYRLVILAGAAAVLEALCRAGVITALTMPPPSKIVLDLVSLLAAGKMTGAIVKTLANVAIAACAASLAGVILGVAIHRLGAFRRALEPLFATYYAIPVYAFYPLFIILFGLGDAPQILIGFMLAVVAVIVNTLNGLDRVPRVLAKTARVYRMGTVRAAFTITLPYAAPYVFIGVKLAIAYAFIGIIGAEFIMSRNGLGYEINFAYNNFDNNIMYPLILLILIIATLLTVALDRWEKTLLSRRERR